MLGEEETAGSPSGLGSIRGLGSFIAKRNPLRWGGAFACDCCFRCFTSQAMAVASEIRRWRNGSAAEIAVDLAGKMDGADADRPIRLRELGQRKWVRCGR